MKQKRDTGSYNPSHLPTPEQHDKYKYIAKAHVESFNFLLKTGIQKAVSDLEPVYYQYKDINNNSNQEKIESFSDSPEFKFWLENVQVAPPVLPPSECRIRGVNYQSSMSGDLCIQDTSSKSNNVIRLKRKLGYLPIMVMSDLCTLSKCSPAKLVKKGEDGCEFGGYFIINGAERLIRLLQVPRRNFPLGLKRPSFQKRGNMYTDLGIMIRCARHSGCQSTITNVMHYLEGGMVTIRASVRKQEFLIPITIIMKSLVAGLSDEQIYNDILSLCRGPEFIEMFRPYVLLLTQQSNVSSGVNASSSSSVSLNTQEECKLYLGSRFRIVLQQTGVISEQMSDSDVANIFLDRFILPHTDNNVSKLHTCYILLHKLYSLKLGLCKPDSADALSMQEILMPGHLLTSFIKEKMQESLAAIPGVINVMVRKKVITPSSLASSNMKVLSQILDRSPLKVAANKMSTFLSTGNLVSSTGLDQQQVSGYTIIAERLNFLRFVSHFRSVHRGQFFTTMRTTTVRKLLPDQWGYLCCVHTPDGGPCGLLSHLTSTVEIKANDCSRKDGEAILDLLVAKFGCSDIFSSSQSRNKCLPIILDGIPRLSIQLDQVTQAATYLRSLKCSGQIIKDLEVATITAEEQAYPGIFLQTQAARMVRPVVNLSAKKVEYIGPMEQPYLMIGITNVSKENLKTYTHEETTSLAHLSLIASLTPFSDMNQSPRNMYQCQMGKQTMGTPIHNIYGRGDNKMYKLHNPQCPLVRTDMHTEVKMDEYPNGTNAIVAVISYTGYDMEDSMILNKSSFERGFGHASVYKTKIIDIASESEHSGKNIDRMKFGNPMQVKKRAETKEGEVVNDLKYPNLGIDGLPYVGETVVQDDPLYCIVHNDDANDTISGKHKEFEPATIQAVRLLGPTNNGEPVSSRKIDSGTCKKVSLTLRVNRNPVIGDKFSSRHGQKGVLSVLYPQVDMPFTESGMTPDVIINPHAFPSRMTIGMLIESMAGKAGAMHGHFQNGTPFRFHDVEGDGKLAVDYFGEQLQAAGYSYYGSEPLYSGLSGQLLQADLYIGVVYYQRLRHMVSDKSQVRATGQVNQLTRQPIKGRKKGGGIRLGEMERDALLSHGAAFCLHDRLFNCSDRHVAHICRRCGDLLSPSTQRSSVLSAGQSVIDATHNAKLRVYCRNEKCLAATAHRSSNSDDDHVDPIVLPYVYRYLANELAAMNIKMKMEVI